MTIGSVCDLLWFACAILLAKMSFEINLSVLLRILLSLPKEPFDYTVAIGSTTNYIRVWLTNILTLFIFAFARIIGTIGFCGADGRLLPLEVLPGLRGRVCLEWLSPALRKLSMDVFRGQARCRRRVYSTRATKESRRSVSKVRASSRGFFRAFRLTTRAGLSLAMFPFIAGMYFLVYTRVRNIKNNRCDILRYKV